MNRDAAFLWSGDDRGNPNAQRRGTSSRGGFVLEVNAGRLPIVVGVTGNDTREVV